MSVKSYFESQAHQHVYHKDPDVYNFILKLVTEKNNNKEINILDFGCGDGSFIKSLLNNNIPANYFATDISSTMINMAKENLKENPINLFVADGFNLPLSNKLNFDLIHTDSVFHHLIGKSRKECKILVNKMLEILIKKLKKNGNLILEEMYYNSYFYPTTTSSIIFHGLKLFNKFNIDINKIIKEYHKGLEVRFLYEKEIYNILAQYGKPILIKKMPSRVTPLYRMFLLKNLGHITYLVQKE